MPPYVTNIIKQGKRLSGEILAPKQFNIYLSVSNLEIQWTDHLICRILNDSGFDTPSQWSDYIPPSPQRNI